MTDRPRDWTWEMRAAQGSGDWFSSHLLRLIIKADPENRERLRLGFPDHVAAVERWHAGQGEFAGPQLFTVTDGHHGGKYHLSNIATMTQLCGSSSRQRLNGHSRKGGETITNLLDRVERTINAELVCNRCRLRAYQVEAPNGDED